MPISDPAFHPNERLRVRTEGAVAATGESAVVHVAADRLVIRWPIAAGRRLAIGAGDTIAVLFSRGGTAFEFLATVLDTSDVPECLLTIRPTTSFQEIQRRDHFRVSAHGRAELSARVVALAEYKHAEFDARRAEGEVYNISAGGCSIVLPAALPIDSVYDVKLVLQGDWDEPVFTRARVVWCRKFDDLSFEHGLAFCNISEGLRRRMMRFVFDAQREQMPEDG